MLKLYQIFWKFRGNNSMTIKQEGTGLPVADTKLAAMAFIVYNPNEQV
jgi:hypothetical protein